MEQQFKAGDIVRLKSGGPDMTVEEFNATLDTVECQWFAGKKLERSSFSPETLVPVEPEEDDDEL